MDARLRFEDNTEKGRYLLACARIRGISPQSLMKRLINVIAKDQLVASVLDDEGEIRKLKKHERPYRERKSDDNI